MNEDNIVKIVVAIITLFGTVIGIIVGYVGRSKRQSVDEAKREQEQADHFDKIFDENQIKFQPKKENCRSAFFKEICRYKENDKFFLNKDAIVTINDFSRNEVYNPKSPLYVDESSLFLSLEKAIECVEAIKDAYKIGNRKISKENIIEII